MVGVTTQTEPSESVDVKVAIGAIKEDIQYIRSDNPGNAGAIFCDGKKDWVYHNGVARLRTDETKHTHTANTIWLGVAASQNNIENNVVDSDSWSVRFDANGHGTMSDDQYVADGGTITKPQNPKASGLAFGGWYKEAECTNAWNFDSETVSEDITLYAKWIDATVAVTNDNTTTYYDSLHGAIEAAESGSTIVL